MKLNRSPTKQGCQFHLATNFLPCFPFHLLFCLTFNLSPLRWSPRFEYIDLRTLGQLVCQCSCNECAALLIRGKFLE